MESKRILDKIANDGFVIIEDVLEPTYIKDVKKALTQAIKDESDYHGTKNYSDFGMVLLCSLYGKLFNDLFANEKFLSPFEEILGNGCIVYAYTSSSMPPSKSNFSNRIHVDCPRLIPNYVTNMGATILLDDFTEDNGATWFLPGSHNRLEKPSEEEFYSNAKRLIAPAGSVFYFNARLWHAGGNNTTDIWRHALTVNMVRPWMKQRIDIPRAMERIDISQYSDRVLQKLGYHAQVPANYNEYYVEPHLRKYKQIVE